MSQNPEMMHVFHSGRPLQSENVQSNQFPEHCRNQLKKTGDRNGKKEKKKKKHIHTQKL